MKLINGKWHFNVGDFFEYELNMDTPAARTIRAEITRLTPTKEPSPPPTAATTTEGVRK